MLANVETFRLEEPDVCAWALDRLDRARGEAGRRLRRPRARDRTARRRRDAPGRSAAGSGATPGAGSPRSPSRSRPRRPTSTTRWGRATSTCDRSRSTTASGVWVVPGGLTRVALPEGQPRRELQPGRRLQGHLGPRQPDRRSRAGAGPDGARRAPPGRAAARAGPRAGRRRRGASSSDDEATRRAEPHRGVALLDRSLHRARRGHRAPARRPLPPPARGPVGGRGHRVRGAAARDGRRPRRARSPRRTPTASPSSSRSTRRTPRRSRRR